MNLNNPFVDTNIIITYLFKYEPEHKLTISLFNQKLYFSENVLVEVNYIFKEKKQALIILFESIISILEQEKEDIINFNKFKKIILNKKILLTYKNHKVSEKDLIFFLETLWNTEDFISELTSNIIIKLREYVTYIQRKLLLEKENIINDLIKIPKSTKAYPLFEKDFLKIDPYNKADLKIILDMYDFYLKNKQYFDFITFDKNLIFTLNKLNYEFIKNIISKRELIQL